MAQVIYAIMRQKRNTYEWFQHNNPTLDDGQIGIISSGQYRNCFKVGDGVTSWTNLSWVTDYEIIMNKPSIDGVTLTGNVTLQQIGVASADEVSNHIALTTAHGSTATPEAYRIAMYDEEAGLKSGKVPEQDTDVIRLQELEQLIELFEIILHGTRVTWTPNALMPKVRVTMNGRFRSVYV